MKPILALDSSGKTASVCIFHDGIPLFEKTIDEGLTHSETLLCLVQQAFETTGLGPEDMGLYAVTSGPGSFTGLRIALALVKGLALPFHTPTLPVSTLGALALASGFEGTVISALDARRGEVYWAAFQCHGGCQRLTEDRAEPVGEIAKYIDFTCSSIVFVGDGADLCYNTYKYRNIVRHPNDSGMVSIAYGAALAAHDAAQQANIISADELCPRYLRLSQAERERAERSHTIQAAQPLSTGE